MTYAQKIDSNTKVKLKDIDTVPPKKVSEEVAKAETELLHAEIEKLEELMYASATHSLLIVLQGRDTSGKDGTIRKLSTCLNVQHANVASFKQPTKDELGHDFLWRIHKQTPTKGKISIFNRSHYEDVLVTRVHDLIPKSEMKPRYHQINRFEEMIHVEANTLILKFYLHISKKEQEVRLLEREKEVHKAWKLSVGDWKERQFWGDYTDAFEEMLEHCSAKHAPWFIVPADKKWYRDLCIAHAIVEALSPFKKDWEKALEEVGKEAKKELAEYRKSLSK